MMKIGIFFGGASREREISFAGGRTVYDNLDKSLFEAVPIFIDGFNNFILLDWQYIYKGTIRDFFPPIQALPPSPNAFQIYSESLPIDEANYNECIKLIGRKIEINELPQLIDFAFLALHGEFGEDGSIQGLLQWLKIPYSGSGIMPSAFGMDKAAQKRMLSTAGFNSPPFELVNKHTWQQEQNKKALFDKIKTAIGFPLAIKPANQGSSVGASIILNADESQFINAVDKAFFCCTISSQQWVGLDHKGKINRIKELTDIREGLGLPILLSSAKHTNIVEIKHPEQLFAHFESHFAQYEEALKLEAIDTEKEVLIEGFIKGKEFSCIVIQDEQGNPIALPPTEIVKGQELFDYRSKYMPGLSRKITPINIPDEQIQAIRKACQQLFSFVGFDVYARIDGFINEEGKIFLNDPNTTSGMLPSSFFFHQSAEIGLNPSQFITFIISTSLQQRVGAGATAQYYRNAHKRLNEALQSLHAENKQKIKVGVIMGGYSSERHISVESGRNIYEKLASSAKYQPIPFFLSGSDEQFFLYKLPIQIMLKDNADDIRDKISAYKTHPVIEIIKQECVAITKKFAGNQINFAPESISFEQLAKEVDEVFIALHGRPGEDGSIQKELLKHHIPFNGSGVESSLLTINKYNTLQQLKKHGFQVTEQLLIYKNDWLQNAEACLKQVSEQLHYPLIAKPVDDGCSSAVKKIHNAEELSAYLRLLYREQVELMPQEAQLLHLKLKEEFPQKQVVLLENLISKNGAAGFMEITGGMLTHLTEEGTLFYELFEPSETLADGEVLSLEEKFLAGQGQNITPARFAVDTKQYKIIAKQVKKTLEDAAKILGVEGYCRIDAFVRIYDDLRAETIIIEVNSLPGMTPATCIYHQAALQRYQPFQFIDKILEFGVKRQKLSEQQN